MTFDTRIIGGLMAWVLAVSFAVSVAVAQQPAALTKKRDVAPVYPEQARQARVQGVVIVEIAIGTDGRVSQTRILRSVPLLDDAALAAVRQWEYDATGLTEPVITTVQVPFSLNGQPPAAPSRNTGTTAAARPRQTGPVDENFTAQGLVNERLLRAIYLGYLPQPDLLPAVMRAYLTAFANRCSVSLPPNKVEMTSLECKTSEVREWNGLVSRTCIEWVDVPNGLFADPELYEARKQLDRRQTANTTIGTLLSTTKETLAGAKAAPRDMARLVGMNVCGGPGLERFGENLRRFALELPPLKAEGTYVFSIRDLEQSRDPELFAHYLLWGMSRYGQMVTDRPDYPDSFDEQYAMVQDTFNALAELNGREKMIAAAKQIMDAPKTDRDRIANPTAIGCRGSLLYSCYTEHIEFITRARRAVPGAPAPADESANPSPASAPAPRSTSPTDAPAATRATPPVAETSNASAKASGSSLPEGESAATKPAPSRSAAAQPSGRAEESLDGEWGGTLDASGTKLRLRLTLAKGTGRLVSIDQSNATFPLSDVTQAGTRLVFKVPNVNGSFTGDLQDGRIVGTWTQGSTSLPLTFERVAGAQP